MRCTRAVGGVIASSPVAVNPDGTGLVIYFGDNGLNGFDDGGHLWAVNGIDPNAAANCSVKWSFNGYGATPGSQPGAGTWSPPAFAKDKNGRPLVIFGGSSPDDAVYALDARTGARVWRFQANPTGKFDADVGAGPTVSAPGSNGFADGVVYVSGKENVTYALEPPHRREGMGLRHRRRLAGRRGLRPLDRRARTRPCSTSGTAPACTSSTRSPAPSSGRHRRPPR